MPARVNESIQTIRGEIRRIRAAIRGNSALADTLETVQDAILMFMDTVNDIDPTGLSLRPGWQIGRRSPRP